MATLLVGPSQPFTDVANALAVANPADIIDIVELVTGKVICNKPFAKLTSSNGSTWQDTTDNGSPLFEIQAGMNVDLEISDLDFMAGNVVPCVNPAYGVIKVTGLAQGITLDILRNEFGVQTYGNSNGIHIEVTSLLDSGADANFINIARNRFSGNGPANQKDSNAIKFDVLSQPVEADQITIVNNYFGNFDLIPAATGVIEIQSVPAPLPWWITYNTFWECIEGNAAIGLINTTVGANNVNSNLFINCTVVDIMPVANLVTYLYNASTDANHPAGADVSNIAGIVDPGDYTVPFYPEPTVGGALIAASDPAVAGTAGESLLDIVGTVRPQNVVNDIGCFETIFVPPAPVPPFGRRTISCGNARINKR